MTTADTPYESLADAADDQRWAFGTGFTDPLAGVDTQLPGGVEAGDLAAYCLMLGDDALVMSHRLQEWVSRAPELEEETALANIALDLLGQARPFLARAGQVDGSGRDEDAMAFLRDGAAFRNVRLVEVVDADFAGLVARLFVFSAWRLAVLVPLRESRDPVLSAVAAKGVKELIYHRDYAAQWVIRLGDGTAISRARLVAGLDAIRPLLPGLFQPHPVEVRLAAAGVAVDPSGLRASVEDVLEEVLAAATLTADLPTGVTGSAEPGDAAPGAAGATPPGAALTGSTGATPPGGVVTGTPAAGIAAVAPSVSAGATGRDGPHTAGFGELLAELQSVARAHPGATW